MSFDGVGLGAGDGFELLAGFVEVTEFELNAAEVRGETNTWLIH